jgi:hypothetical protein
VLEVPMAPSRADKYVSRGAQQEKWVMGKSNPGCVSRAFQSIGVVTGGIIGACCGYFVSPKDPVINAFIGFLIGGLIGGIVGALVPVLVIIGIIALIIWVINRLQ